MGTVEESLGSSVQRGRERSVHLPTRLKGVNQLFDWVSVRLGDIVDRDCPSVGIIRILKSDIRQIEGTNQTRDLRMYSAPASATTVATASSAPAAAKEMSQVLKEGEALFGQTVLDAQAKVTAFRRLTEKWRALELPSNLQDLHGRAARALQMSTEAFEAEAEGTAPDAKERIESAKKVFAEVQAEVNQQSKEG